MVEFDPGSFKDPDGRVFFSDGRVLRTLSQDAAARMQTLFDDNILPELIDRGLVIPTKLVETTRIGLDPATLGKTVMEHARVPVITYPYEWPFDMLRDGALLTLDLLEYCLGHNLILKDATPYNIALMDGRLRFIDLLSIDRYRPGQPWDGYSQFCKEFLFPLMMSAYRRIDFRPWLRSELKGIPPSQFVRLLSWRDRLRPGVFRHAVLQARLERSFATRDADIRGAFMKAELGKELIVSNIRGLRKVIRRLVAHEDSHSPWVDYRSTHSYSEDEGAAKRQFIERSLSDAKCARVIDLGANTGDYALIAAKHADLVICADSDAACVNVVFRRMRNERDGHKLVPMVVDLTNPSPSQGWALKERKSFFDRVETDGFVALALVHHIRISGNVPLANFVSMLALLGRAGVIEWVDKEDHMVQRLLRNRADVFPDYSWDGFKAALESHFIIRNVQESHGGLRKLCYVAARGAAS